ncbi:MAG: septum formation initiator family protein [Magnetococcales bacterium]|nr:septum formation initiator family protein [Magnetococcales bacterium]
MEGGETSSKWVWVGLTLLAANGWAQYVLWFGEQGLVRWRRTESQLMLVKQEINRVSDRIHLLQGDILLVEREPTVLEEVARRDLGLVYPDEILFIFPRTGKERRSP